MRSTPWILCSNRSIITSSAPSWPALCSGCSAAKAGRLHYRPLGGVQLLNTEDIYWLETRDRMLHYHTSTGVWSVRSSLQNAEKQLAPPTTLPNATSVTLSICGMCGRSRTIWSRLGRTGWRSAAASGLPSWLRSPPMLGVPCNAAKSPTISFSSCLWDTALGRSTDLLAPAPALAALLAAGAALPDSLHSPFHIFIMGGSHAFLAVPAGGGAYSVLYVDDFRFPQLHPVGLVRRQYCAIWGILSALTTFELWQLLVWCLAQVNIFLPLDQPSALLLQLLFLPLRTACCG